MTTPANPKQTLAAFVYNQNDTYPSNLEEIQLAVDALASDNNPQVQQMVKDTQERLNEWGEWEVVQG
jgi:hypothetical protein